MNALALLALAVVAPVSAQEYRQAQAAAAQERYEQMIAAQTATTRDGQGGRVRSLTVDATLTAMNDGPEAGGWVSRLLDEDKLGVYTVTQAEAVKSGVVDGRPAILLSDALPAHPRVYGPLIAAEAAKSMFTDMPACAEREYMRVAVAARVFAELGGDFKALPKVDGDDAPAVKAAVGRWADGAERALEDAGRASGLPLLADIKPTAAQPAAALDAADKRYVAFLMEESDVRRSLR